MCGREEEGRRKKKLEKTCFAVEFLKLFIGKVVYGVVYAEACLK